MNATLSYFVRCISGCGDIFFLHCKIHHVPLPFLGGPTASFLASSCPVLASRGYVDQRKHMCSFLPFGHLAFPSTVNDQQIAGMAS